ncbi:MAG: hypothetical protein EOM83_07845 [Clostridia bacterium]|nr:hypothetical protein [Clostridia bacterium]
MKRGFYCFPFPTKMMVLYKNPAIFKTSYFHSLSIQISPKESFLFRIRKTRAGHHLYRILFLNKKHHNETVNDNIKLIYINKGKQVQFEFTAGAPKWVHTGKLNDKSLTKTSFKGLPLLFNYSLYEFEKTYPLIEKVLRSRWELLRESPDQYTLHGDYTHLNVVVDENYQTTEIDQKAVTNSILFDHFYFYSYLMQCLGRCRTLPEKQYQIIERKMADLLKNIFDKENKNDLIKWISEISLDDAPGLMYPEKSLHNFRNKVILSNR